jgi:broad specificity phosphatase PhoE
MQARSLSQALRHKRWHRYYCSDLPRAKATAKIALDQRQMHEDDAVGSSETDLIVYSTNLREVCFGVKEGFPRGTSVGQAKRLRAEALGVKEHEIQDFAETQEQILHRQHAFVKQVVEDLLQDGHDNVPDEASVFCMAHGGYILRFLQNVCGMEKVEKIKNCAVSVVALKYMDVSTYECLPRPELTNLTAEDYLTLHPVHHH